MTKDDLKKLEPVFRETCKIFVLNGGICDAVSCDNCPFDEQYNNKGIDCTSAGYSTYGVAYYIQDPLVLESAKLWLEDNQ